LEELALDACAIRRSGTMPECTIEEGTERKKTLGRGGGEKKRH
jgi:hypothetical protein